MDINQYHVFLYGLFKVSKDDTGLNGNEWPEATKGTAAITRWHYDEATGLLMGKEYDDGKGVSYTYDTGGQLETRQWARLNNGNPLVTTYGYDPNTGELTSIDYSDNIQDIAFTYDRLGRQKTITDAVGTRVFGYNSQLQQETETITGIYNKVITRTYETAGVPGRATGFNLGAGYAVTYGYEAGTGRFRSVNWSAGGKSDTATYSYVPNSDLVYQLSTTFGLATTYAYEADRNLKTQVKNEFNAQLISQYDYNYNNLGLRDHMDTSGSAFTGTPIEPTPETSTYTTNTLNQYTQITKDNGQQTTYTLTYDDDGNLTSIITTGATKVYKYNAENRLIAVEPSTPINGNTKVEFVYDYMGRRVQKKVYIFESSAYSLQSIHLYVYDGWNMIQEMDGTGFVQKSYVWGLDLSQTLQAAGGIGGLLAVVDGSETYQYCYDANCNVGQLIDADDGSIVAHYEYDPFGILLKSSGLLANANHFRFSTKYYDTETGLYYYGYRYYSPSLGRWINRDPIEEKGGVNLYVFVNGDPINNIDSKGLTSIIITTDPTQINPALFPTADKPVNQVYTGLNPCEGYKVCFGSDCCRDGKKIKDPYPQAAYDVCKGFMELYDYKNEPKVRCVANCLIINEKSIQRRYSSCGDRNSARIRVHMKCYASCGFIPTKGLPKGGAEVGWGMLLPDFIKDPLSIW